MVEYSSICAVHNLKLNPNDRSIIYQDHLLTSSKLILEKLKTYGFIAIVGSYTFNTFTDNCNFFSNGNMDENDDLFEYSNRSLSVLQEFINFLWFIKDNSCNLTQYFTYVPALKESVLSMERSSNYTTCTADIVDTPFTSDEILKTADILFEAHNLSSANKNINQKDLFKIDGNTTKGIFKSSMAKMEYSSRNRIERALLFLQSSRTAAFIPLKIGLAMNVLECLFSDTDSGDIIHKIAERTSFYVGETLDERLDIFKSVKAAYTLRSKYFHGQTLDPKKFSQEKMESIALKIDVLLRNVLTKVIMKDSNIFKLNDTELCDWFNRLSFEKNVTCPKYIFK